jgi:hypothetical protein
MYTLQHFRFLIPNYLHDIFPKFPSPACAFHLDYEIRWLLSIFSPIFVAVAMMLLIPLSWAVKPTRGKLKMLFSLSAKLTLGFFIGSLIGNSIVIKNNANNNDDTETGDQVLISVLSGVGGAIVALFWRDVRLVLARIPCCTCCKPSLDDDLLMSRLE